MLTIALGDGGQQDMAGWRVGIQRRDFHPNTFILSADERARCDAMTAAGAAQLRMIAHTCKREIVGAYLGLAPALVPFASGSGAPLLLPPHDSAYVSLSHTVGAVAVAVSSSPVGIDIELIERADNAKSLAARYFAADEIQPIAQSEDPQFEFAWRWTVKEALLKACTLSLSHALATSLGDAPHSRTDAPFTLEAHGARITVLIPEPCYVCSVARL